MGDTRHLVEENEDCLRLAIFTPAADNRKRRVLVFIHGGAFLTGSAVSECYDASTLAQSCDIVVVNISYRLGALGFLHSPKQGIVNLGMADQWCALQWIRRNIHLFGGDASRMTLMGQSPGAIPSFIISPTRPSPSSAKPSSSARLTSLIARKPCGAGRSNTCTS
jgi:para-nitrobenzyl esterase